MRLELRKPAAASAALVLLLAGGAGTDAASSRTGDHESRLERFGEEGLSDIAPAEMEEARALFEKMRSLEESGSSRAGVYEKLVGLQLDLLDELKKTSELQAEAAEAERRSLEAYEEMRLQQAAYEFLVDQILASGLVSQWAVP